MKILTILCLFTVLFCVIPLREAKSQTTGQVGINTQNGLDRRETNREANRSPNHYHELRQKKIFEDSVQIAWVRYFTEPDSAAKATDIEVDDSGNVYVTGYSRGSETDYDYATVKYTTDGVQEWVARYNGPGNNWDKAKALAVDGSGNVYVTGTSWSSGTEADYATVKYNSDGIQQWLACYNGPGNFWDEAKALAVDISGNVYVAGESELDYVTVKYNSDGIQQWVVNYNGPYDPEEWVAGMAVDVFGNVYVTGESGGNYSTVKYTSDGVEQWVVHYNGPGNTWDRAKALAVDISGNVYVTGWSVGLGTGRDYTTVKYNSDGDQEWVARYDGPGSSDEAIALAVDESGNVYVTGESEEDYATVKYTSDGIEQWVVRYNGPGIFSWDMAKALVVDGSGNVYVTGTSYPNPDNKDYVTIKYTTDGVQEWVARYNGPGDLYTTTDLGVDGLGNVYVTGWVCGPPWLAYCTIKYVQTVELRGDVNGDGSINILDVLATVNHILDIQPLEDDALWRADCNGDGVVNILDALGIVNVILGIGECGP